MLDFFDFLMIGFVLAFFCQILAPDLWAVGADPVFVGNRGGAGSYTSTPDYGGDLTWSITPRTTLTFSGLLTYNTGTPGNIPLAGNSYLSKTFTGTVSHQVLPNLQLSLTGNYINNSFQGISPTQNVYLVDAGVRYQVNRNLYLGGDIYHLQQSSTASGGSYSQNIFTLRVGTQF